MKVLKRTLAIILTLMLLSGAFSECLSVANAASYTAVSLKVPYYRQRASGMCSFCAFSMAEAYATGYGANEDVVYQAIRTAHAPAGDGGYYSDPTASPALIDGKRYKSVSTSFSTIYSYLKNGQPVVIYRGGSTMHWAVIYGYNGPTDVLKESGFLVINGVLTNNNSYVKTETLSSFLSASDASLKYAAVRVNGVLAHKNNTSYSQNMNSYFANCSVSGISTTDATIKGIFTNSTSITTAGFYIGTSSSSLKKITKNLAGKADGAGNFRAISYSMSKWYGTLKAGTKYYYQLYYVKNGTEYKSPVNWFMTKGNVVLSSISIKTMPTSYTISGSSITLKGLELYANYSDGTQKTVTSGYTCELVSLSGSNATVKITYSGVSLTKTVNINEIGKTPDTPIDSSLGGTFSTSTNSNFKTVTVTDITETNAKINGSFDLKYISSAGFYIGTDANNLKKVTKSLGGDTDGAGNFSSIFYLMSKWYGTLKPGTKYYFKLFYMKDGKECASPVNWFITKGTPSLTSINVKTAPTEVKYSISSGLKLTGMVLNAVYSDGRTKAVSDGYTYGITAISGNTITVKITYGGCQVVYTVTYGADVLLPDEDPQTKEGLGDINNDSSVTAADARLALRQSVGLEKFTDEQKKRADINGDDKVTAADARIILRISVSLERVEDYM